MGRGASAQSHAIAGRGAWRKDPGLAHMARHLISAPSAPHAGKPLIARRALHVTIGLRQRQRRCGAEHKSSLMPTARLGGVTPGPSAARLPASSWASQRSSPLRSALRARVGCVCDPIIAAGRSLVRLSRLPHPVQSLPAARSHLTFPPGNLPSPRAGGLNCVLAFTAGQ